MLVDGGIVGNDYPAIPLCSAHRLRFPCRRGALARPGCQGLCRLRARATVAPCPPESPARNGMSPDCPGVTTKRRRRPDMYADMGALVVKPPRGRTGAGSGTRLFRPPPTGGRNGTTACHPARIVPVCGQRFEQPFRYAPMAPPVETSATPFSTDRDRPAGHAGARRIAAPPNACSRTRGIRTRPLRIADLAGRPAGHSCPVRLVAFLSPSPRSRASLEAKGGGAGRWRRQDGEAGMRRRQAAPRRATSSLSILRPSISTISNVQP